MNKLTFTKYIPNVVTQKFGRLALQTKAHSPEILFGAGVVTAVGATVLACRATLRVEEVLKETNVKMQDVKTLQHENYSEQDRVKDKAVLMTQASMKLLKLYGPAVGVGLVSIGCFGGSHYILQKRNTALVAAYVGVKKAYDSYRERVQEKFGVDEEREVYCETETRQRTEFNGDKKDETVKKPSGDYTARCFDESNKNWNRQSEYNQMFLQCQQNYANDLLHSRGHVFLNEVYDMLGMERSTEGSVVGWILGESDHISFGVFEGNRYEGMRFVCGDEQSVWLTFNIDGVIYDKI